MDFNSLKSLRHAMERVSEACGHIDAMIGMAEKVRAENPETTPEMPDVEPLKAFLKPQNDAAQVVLALVAILEPGLKKIHDDDAARKKADEARKAKEDKAARAKAKTASGGSAPAAIPGGPEPAACGDEGDDGLDDVVALAQKAAPKPPAAKPEEAFLSLFGGDFS